MTDESKEKIKAAMAEEGFDALLCALPMHVLLLTGYWPIMANAVAVFTVDGRAELIVPEDEKENALAYTGVPITTFVPASVTKMIDPVCALEQPLIARLKDLHLDNAQIGYENKQFLQPASYLTMNLYNSALAQCMHAALPGARLSGADRMLERLKATKTPHALAQLRLGCAAAKAAYTGAAASIMAGASERLIAAAFEMEHSRACAGQPFHRTESFFFCMSGPNSGQADAAYARTRRRLVAEGDLVMVHCNCAYDGWWTDITRTFVAGVGRPEYEKMRTAIADARDAALAAIRPGVTGKAVDHAARQVLERAGYGGNFTHATGHGVGFAAANPNGRPRIHPCSEDVLDQGMTFNVEPAIYFKEHYGMRHCDMVAVTSDGVEVLTDF